MLISCKHRVTCLISQAKLAGGVVQIDMQRDQGVFFHLFANQMILTQEPGPTVEMFVASIDNDDVLSEHQPALRSSKSVRVPHPRLNSPQNLTLTADEDQDEMSRGAIAENKVLKQDLRMTSAELSDTKLELQESHRALRWGKLLQSAIHTAVQLAEWILCLVLHPISEYAKYSIQSASDLSRVKVLPCTCKCFFRNIFIAETVLVMKTDSTYNDRSCCCRYHIDSSTRRHRFALRQWPMMQRGPVDCSKQANLWVAQNRFFEKMLCCEGFGRPRWRS